MIFKRRERPPLSERLRQLLAPRKGFWRGWGYIGKRLRRLPDSPHKIALGFACGAVASFTPFFGLHFFVAAGLAYVLRANILSSLFGTIVGNPLSFPLISTTSLWIGRWIMGRNGNGSDFDAITEAFSDAANSLWTTTKSWFGYGPSMFEGFLVFLDEVFLPYLIGGLAPGLLCGAVCYWLIGPVVAAYQERRRKMLEIARAKHRQAISEELDAYRSRDRDVGDNA